MEGQVQQQFELLDIHLHIPFILKAYLPFVNLHEGAKDCLQGVISRNVWEKGAFGQG